MARGESASKPSRPPRLADSLRGTGDATSGAARPLWVGRALVTLLSLAMLALLGRVVQLQVAPPERIAARLGSQQSSQQVMARRGSLLDRRGRMLATTRIARKVFVDPQLIVDYSGFSERVGYPLGIEPVRIDKAMAQRPGSRYVVIAPELDREYARKLEELDVPGLASEPVSVRDYPHGHLAGQVIGFVGADGVGLEGLERTFNDRLRPQPGRLTYPRDARRRPLWLSEHGYRPPEDGESIRLSIDAVIQASAEEHLAATVEKYNAKSGEIVVMDPNTGEILAMANNPSFAPGDFRNSKKQERRNRCVTDVFEPGSIFKPFIWAMATQMGFARPDEKIDCTKAGYFVFPSGRTLRDAHSWEDPMLSWDEVLIQSSNIGMGKVALRMGDERLYAAMKAFGFGESTRSGLPGEVTGLVWPLSKWSSYSKTSVPMGQEVSVTPLQVTRAFCAIANGGELVTPSYRVVDEREPARTSVRERVLEPAIAAHTREVLRQTVTEGTGRKADSKLYELFGKTGTAQLPDFENGGYHDDRYVASFMAGAPVSEPRLVIGCFIHDPDRSIGHYGGTVAGPAVRKVMEESLLYLGVPPLVEPDADDAE